MKRPLGEVMRVKHGYAFGGGDFSEDPGLPTVVTPGNFRIGGGFQDARAKTFSGEIPSGYVLKPDELIITMTDLSKAADTLGSPALVPGDRVYLHNQRIGLVQITRPDRVDTRYLHYRLRLQDYRHHVVATASGTSVRHTSPGRLESFKTELPPLPTQRAIAEVLGALDDKIAANQTLASSVAAVMLARLRSWSADSPAVALSTIATSKAVQVSPSQMKAVSHFSLPAFDAGEVPADDSGASIMSNKLLIEAPSVLMSRLNPRIPRVWDIPWLPTSQAVASTEFVVLEPVDLPTGALWAALCQDSVSKRLQELARGTSGSHQRVRPGEAMAVEVPDPRVLSDGQKGLLGELSRRRSLARNESRHLATLRDTLLPHLMSGRLTVRDAEARVEAAL